jgi:glutathione synthase/RimK-type ligase-like ATP-grasp enzyme
MQRLIVRYQGFGKEACDIMAKEIGCKVVAYSKNTVLGDQVDGCEIIPWGCRMKATLNSSEKLPSDKGHARLLMAKAGVPVPELVFHSDSGFAGHAGAFPVILRPHVHCQGKHLHLCSNIAELLTAVMEHKTGFYVSGVVKKKAEYRVHVVGPRVVFVQNKLWVSSDGLAGTHNVQGHPWKWMKWSELEVLPGAAECMEAAIKACRACGYDFGGVDVMLDENDKPCVIEVNSAPGLTGNEAVKYGKAIKALLDGEAKKPKGHSVTQLLWKGVQI